MLVWVQLELASGLASQSWTRVFIRLFISILHQGRKHLEGNTPVSFLSASELPRPRPALWPWAWPEPSGGSCWSCACWPWRWRACATAGPPAGAWGTVRCGWSPSAAGLPRTDAGCPDPSGISSPRRPGKRHPTPGTPRPEGVTYCTEWRSCRETDMLSEICRCMKMKHRHGNMHR